MRRTTPGGRTTKRPRAAHPRRSRPRPSPHRHPQSSMITTTNLSAGARQAQFTFSQVNGGCGSESACTPDSASQLGSRAQACAQPAPDLQLCALHRVEFVSVSRHLGDELVSPEPWAGVPQRAILVDVSEPPLELRGSMTKPGDVTLASYEAAAQRYRDKAAAPGPSLLAFLDRVAELVGDGEILELGSGPGREARYLEGRGARVRRTDVTRAFVEMMRGDGYAAHVLDIRVDEFGGPYAAVFANAVLLYLTREDFDRTLDRVRSSVVDGGVLAFTLKEGDGEAWSHAKLDLPRYFTYWREPAVRVALESAGWTVVSIEHVTGRTDSWLYVLARA